MAVTKEPKRIHYDVDQAAFLLRWVGLYASRPDADMQPCLVAVKEFLDGICPTCHGAGDYFIGEDEREPCDDCGMWTGDAVIVYGAYNL